MRTEAELERYFHTQLQRRGARAVKLAPTERGVPDRLVVIPPGGLYLVELKTVVGRLSDIQLFWHEQLKKLGVTVHVLYGKESVDDWITWALDQAYDLAEIERSRAVRARRRQRAIENEMLS